MVLSLTPHPRSRLIHHTIRVQVTLSLSCKEILQITAHRLGENMSEFYKNAAYERILKLVENDPLLRQKILLVESTCAETTWLQQQIRDEEV